PTHRSASWPRPAAAAARVLVRSLRGSARLRGALAESWIATGDAAHEVARGFALTRLLAVVAAAERATRIQRECATRIPPDAAAAAMAALLRSEEIIATERV